jgi:hypothetical protein
MDRIAFRILAVNGFHMPGRSWKWASIGFLNASDGLQQLAEIGFSLGGWRWNYSGHAIGYSPQIMVTIFPIWRKLVKTLIRQRQSAESAPSKTRGCPTVNSLRRITGTQPDPLRSG